MSIVYIQDVYPNYALYHRPLDWQSKGLMQSASGYGAKLTTEYMVNIRELSKTRLYRVYCTCYSNIGSCWVMVKGQKLFLNDTVTSLPIAV